MDADRKELVHRLFVLATEIAEAAHETATSGQASTVPHAALIFAAEALCRRADELKAVGRTISIAAGRKAPESPGEISS